MISRTVLDAFQFGCAAARGSGPKIVDWRGSPFESLRSMANKRKSVVAVWVLHHLVQARYGVALSAPAKPTAARSHQGVVLKIKMSVQWDTGQLAFEQIRSDEQYNYMVFIGFLPSDFMLWVIPRRIVLQRSETQHAEGSRWVRFTPDDPPTWLKPFGGNLNVGMRVLGKSLKIS